VERFVTSARDARRVRALLVGVDATWLLRTWDASCAAKGTSLPEGCRVEHTHLWTDEDGGPTAVLLVFGDGEEVVPVAAPAHRALEATAIARGERAARAAGRRRVRVICEEDDSARGRLLASTGYVPTEEGSCAYRRRFPGPDLPWADVAPGYRIRTTRSDDSEELAALLNEAFGRDAHDAAHLRAFRDSAPCFVDALDLVAETRGGALIAYVGTVWDETNRRALCEPVCTHSAHRRRGLARALLVEGMRRAEDLGVETVGVETGADNPANALYASLGFDECHRARFWEKPLTP